MERTIGVTIAVPQPFGAQLDAARRSTGDPLAEQVPAHVTLLGPTVLPVSAELDDRIDAHLAAVAARYRRFTVHLRGTGTFRPLTRVVFVAVTRGAAQCVRLAEAIRSGPLYRDLSHPYHPHVTVGHDVADDALDAVYLRLAGFRARFTVDRFTRHEHYGDGVWRPVRDYPLASAR